MGSSSGWRAEDAFDGLVAGWCSAMAVEAGALSCKDTVSWTAGEDEGEMSLWSKADRRVGSSTG